ncbi:MAG: ribonuclease III [Chloroflexi bacterium]|nr:ribonuclease III [Chloroflexota bacterium]
MELDSQGLNGLQGSIGVTFADPSLLLQSLVHRSYLNENPRLSLLANGRLEFLGDAVLGLIIGEELYRRFPYYGEGELTRLRSVLVRRETLANWAGALGLGEQLYLGHGEEAKGGRRNQRNLAGVLEAVIGAIFVDAGLASARNFVLKVAGAELKAVGATWLDYKSALQEYTQRLHHTMPRYRVVTATGPEHEKEFQVEVVVDGVVWGRGVGRSKRDAEMEAARVALSRWGNGVTGSTQT